MLRSRPCLILLVAGQLVSCGTLRDGKPNLGLINQPSVSGDPCRNADWFEVGRVDGLGGIPLGTSLYVGRCKAAGVPIDDELYHAGWQRGLIDYCTPDRGYDAGRNGQTYAGVCPKNLEDGFLKRFRVGSRIAAIEESNVGIELEMEKKLGELASANSTGGTDSILSDALSRLPGSTVPEPRESKEKKSAALKAEVEKLRESLSRNQATIRELEQSVAL